MLLGHTIDSLGFGPAVAAKLALGFASDVTALAWEDGPLASAGRYGGKVRRELDFPGKRDGAADAARRAPSSPRRARARAGACGRGRPASRATEQLGFREVEAGDVDITKAEFLLSVGRGIEDKDALPQFEELAEKHGRDAERVAPARRRRLGVERAPGRVSRARPSSRRSTWRSASRARSSTWRGCRRRTRSSRSTPIRRRRSSGSRTTAPSPTCSTWPTSWPSSSRLGHGRRPTARRARRRVRSSGTSEPGWRCCGTCSPASRCWCSPTASRARWRSTGAGHGGGWPPRSELPGRFATASRILLSPRLDRAPRPLRRAGRTAAIFYGFVVLFVGTVILAINTDFTEPRVRLALLRGQLLPRLLDRARRARAWRCSSAWC